MFKSKTVTKLPIFAKFFEWEIENIAYLSNAIQSETMTATGFDGIKYTGVFNYSPGSGRCPQKTFDIVINPTPPHIQYFYEDESGGTRAGKEIRNSCGRIKLWVNIVMKVSTAVISSALEYQEPKKTLLEDLKEIWKNDSSSQFTIKCDNQDVIAIKPIMCARSVVFRKMFETDMKEKAQNRVVIDDFTPQVVQKMVEFCENESIADSKDCEEDLFKIAHKYEIESLKDFAITAMAKTARANNIASRLELAQLYELEDFHKWCKNFA